MFQQLSLFSNNLDLGNSQQEIDRLQASITELQKQQRRTKAGSEKWQELQSAIALRQQQLVRLWQGKPAEEEVEPQFAVGEEVIFRDDSIATQQWHNQRCVIESLNSPVKVGRLVVRFSDGIRLHPTEKELVKIPHVQRDSVERAEFHWVELYPSQRRYLYWRYSYLPNPNDINQIVKLHIPGRSSSIRDGRAELVKEAIAEGKSSREIIELIRSW